MVRVTSSLALLFCLSVQCAHAGELPKAPALPEIPNHVFRVAERAAPAQTADDTKVIQAAIDAAEKAGGGTVELTPGEYIAGPLRLASKINLHLDAGVTLKMLPIDRYPGGTRNPDNFISAKGMHDLAITGAGTIDGQGAAWWPLAKTQKGAKRPRMVVMNACDRILIEGVKLQNSPMFHIAISGHSTNVTVRGVTIHAPPSTDPVTPSHNTDACDVSGSHVLIENCNVSVGDDDFTCGGGTSDVHITHCTYGYGHGVSIGSYTNGGVSDISVDNCTFTNTECGIRIKSDRGRGGNVHNLSYSHLKMTNVNIPILIYTEYMARERKYRNLNDLTAEIAASYPAEPVAAKTPNFHDISFSDITATAAKGKRAGLIWGLPESPVANILLKNVTITADKPFGIYNAKNVRVENCRITTPQGENKLSTGNAQVTVRP